MIEVDNNVHRYYVAFFIHESQKASQIKSKSLFPFTR